MTGNSIRKDEAAQRSWREKAVGTRSTTSDFKNRAHLNALVLRAVNEGSAILGDDPVKRAFYYHIGKRAKMKREEIPCKLDAFHKALVDLFDQGAWILERRMARILYEKLGLEFEEHDGWTLSDYVKHAERDLSKMI